MALRDVLIDELRDMYSAENQLVKALPKLAKGAKNWKLKQLFAAHLEETKGQVERLKLVFTALGEKPTGQHCNGMEGVIEEGKDALEKDEEGASFDSGLGAAKKITAAGIPILKQSASEPDEPKMPKTGKEKYSAKKSKADEAKAAPDLQK